MRSGFSLATVVLSYFLVAGGLFTGTLALGLLKVNSEVVQYAALAAGGFLGGFVAARASRGSTILEPAIGGALVIATLVGLVAGSAIGRMIWAVDQEHTIKFVALLAGLAGGGALAGAFVSEKLLGEATTSSLPWIVYTALSVFGACLMATLIAAALFATSQTATADSMAQNTLVGMAGGCLLAGLAIGASARTRPLLAAALGAALGVGGYFVLITRGTAEGGNRDTLAGIAILAVGGAIVALLGTLGGWVVVGRKQAG
jgi:hypothetical protein